MFEDVERAAVCSTVHLTQNALSTWEFTISDMLYNLKGNTILEITFSQFIAVFLYLLVKVSSNLQAEQGGVVLHRNAS